MHHSSDTQIYSTVVSGPMSIVALQLCIESQRAKGGFACHAFHLSDRNGRLRLMRRDHYLAQKLVGRVWVFASIEAATLLIGARRCRIEPPNLSSGRLSSENNFSSIGTRSRMNFGGFLVRTPIVGEPPSFVQLVLFVCPRSCEHLFLA